MIGIGLGTPKDVTVKGLEIIKTSKKVFLEHYTSIQKLSKQNYEDFFEKEIIIADRNLVEKQAQKILEHAKKHDISFLVVGDVFQATTHTDLYLRAKKQDIPVKIIPNAGIMNVASHSGLQLYKFGKTTSIVFDDDGWLPKTPYETIKQNQQRGLHTLCLLDIKVAEPTKQNLRKGINKPAPPRYMTIKQAIRILEKLEKKQKQKIITPNTKLVGLARMGTDNYMKYGKLPEIKKHDFKKPLHTLIIIGKTDEIEEEMLNTLTI